MKHGPILTMLDLKDIAELGRAKRIRKFMLTALAVVCLFAGAFTVALVKMDSAKADLKKAEATIATLAAERDDAVKTLKMYRDMGAVTLNKRKLSKPVHLTGEMVVMFVGDGGL